MIKYWLIALLVLCSTLYPVVLPVITQAGAGVAVANDEDDVCSDSDEDGKCDVSDQTE